VTGRRGRRHKQLVDDLTETRQYWKLKEALDLPLALEENLELSQDRLRNYLINIKIHFVPHRQHRPCPLRKLSGQ
jgi:hypothetical protein